MTDLLGFSYLGEDGYLQAEAWARSRGATLAFVDNARRYWTLSQGFGVRPEVLYAQSAKETGFGRFGGVITAEWHNPAGIKVARPQDAPWPDERPPTIPEDKWRTSSDYNPNAHDRGASWDEGVRQHFNHHSAYVWGDDPNAIVFGVPWERRAVIARLSWAGTVRTVEDMWRWAGRQEYATSLIQNYLNPLMAYFPR